jgi:hypothetical protein
LKGGFKSPFIYFTLIYPQEWKLWQLL